jgi:aminopeptidase N
MRRATRLGLVLAASTAALFATCGASLAKTAPPASVAGHIALPRDVAPLAYDIAVVPDAKALSFTGHVTIDVEVKRPTAAITLNAADIDFGRVRLDEGAAAPAITQDTAQQTATFTFAAPIAPGVHRLSIDYAGRIYQQASGLFALDYDTPKGKARALFTQFENSDARRFVPSFDEPGQKATFKLTVTVPADLMAVSNMPVASSTPLAGGLKRVSFATTPKMSSYLLFFGLGDFERVSKMVDGVDVGVIVKRGDTAQAAYALDAASQILPYYDRYFGTKYPLPKLDLIAGPGESQFFGAMENWGAIFYFEYDLLIDPRFATEDDRQRVYVVVAHEMAHQWFGDLVTMQWWDDLWLNEGFASWMENKVTDHFHPEWKVWLQELNSKQRAMSVDAKAGTHPIITPIPDVLAAAGAFDDITYDKGAAVIRMLEGYTGEDAWRDGVRRYIAAHAYGNAVTDDLWASIDAGSPKKITDIAHDFTLQAGVPLIESAQSDCAGHVLTSTQTLAQGRFGLDAEDKAPRAWRTPVLLASPDGVQRTSLVTRPGAPTAVGVAGCGPLVVNAGQTGYFRSLYSPKEAADLAGAYPRLSADDQLGLLNDTSAEGQAAYAPMAQYLDLTARLPDDANPVVWTTLAGQLGRLDTLYEGLPGQAALRAYALARLGPELARLGWEARPDEPANTSGERSALLGVLGRMGEPAVGAEARRRFAALQSGATLPPATRKVALAIVAVNATPADWDALHAMAKTAPTAQQKSELYSLLGRARDPALGSRALDLSLSGEMEPTTAPAIISSVSFLHPKMALAFTTAHWTRIEALLDSDGRIGFVAHLASGASDPAVAAELQAFAEAHVPGSGRLEIEKAKAAIADAARVRQQRLPEVDRWLAGRAKAG